MRNKRVGEILVAAASVWALAVACGARTGLPSTELLGTSGGGGDAGPVLDAAPPPECLTASDCPAPLPNQCGVALCLEGVCSLRVLQTCDDADPCTLDSCMGGGCVFKDGRIDSDGDGHQAVGSASDPRTALGCGDDCDDTRVDIFPGAPESCDGSDNDCDGLIDEGSQLIASSLEAKRVSGFDIDHAAAIGLAFDGQSFGATFTGFKCPGVPTPDCTPKAQGYFRQLSPQGDALVDQKPVARVNAASYAGPLLWTGERYLMAYEDARQDMNYEVYLDVLDRQGERQIEDLRVTNAERFSVHPTLLWTGSEALVVWDDRRSESGMDGAAIFGQRIAADGSLVASNVQLSPAGLQGESPSIAVAQGPQATVGVVFTTVSPSDEVRLAFLTTSRSLDASSSPTTIDFIDPDSPVLTVVNGKYIVTFTQKDSGVGPSVFGTVLGANGVTEIAPMPVTLGAAHARSHATYSYGDRFVMVWADDFDGFYQLYAQTFDDKLRPLSQRQRLNTGSAPAYGPVLAPASDGSLGVLFTAENEGPGRRQAYFTSMACGVVTER